MDISSKLKLNELFDAYGKLLAEKQQEILNLYCFKDCGLTEIAENLSISRQAVHDAVSSAQKLLVDFENKVGFIKYKKDLRKNLDKLNSKF